MSSPPSNTKDKESDGTQLLTRILEDPSDDAARLVYADWLQERSDPRGEFIALSFEESKRTLSKKEKRRFHTLINDHEKEWIGPLTLVTAKSSRAYVKGFLQTCEVVMGGVTARDQKAALSHPAWSTVEVLRFHPNLGSNVPTTDTYAYKFTVQACMRSLRRLEHLRSNDLLTLLSHKEPLPVEHIELGCESPAEFDILRINREPLLTALAPGLPKLVDLSIPRLRDPEMLLFLQGTELARRLKRLHLRVGVHDPSLWCWALRTLKIEVPEVVLTRVDSTEVVTLACDQSLRWTVRP